MLKPNFIQDLAQWSTKSEFYDFVLKDYDMNNWESIIDKYYNVLHYLTYIHWQSNWKGLHFSTILHHFDTFDNTSLYDKHELNGGICLKQRLDFYNLNTYQTMAAINKLHRSNTYLIYFLISMIDYIAPMIWIAYNKCWFIVPITIKCI